MNNYLNFLSYSDVSSSNWLDLTILLGKCSKSIRLKDENVERNVIDLMHYVLCIAKQNNINMNCSWNRWINKVDYKIYY